MYEWHYVHYCDELAKAGHKITDCNPVQVLGRIGSAEEYSEILVSTAKQMIGNKLGPHLMLSNATDKTLLPDAIDILRKLGIACVNFSVDDLTVPFDVRKIGSHFDLCWTTYIGAEVMLKKYGCRVIYLPMAANPYFFKAGTDHRAHILCFVGSRYGARINYVSQLAREEIPLKVRGAGWLTNPANGTHELGSLKRARIIDSLRLASEYIRFPAGRKILAGALKKRTSFGTHREILQNLSQVDIAGPLSTFEEMVSIYSSCSASLGVLEAGSTYTLNDPLVYYRLREFEAPMAGCAHIVRRVSELEESFDENKEMIFYSSIEECIDKARFYLAPERYNLCHSIGEKARTRATRDHTWLNRFAVLTKTLGIKMCSSRTI